MALWVADRHGAAIQDLSEAMRLDPDNHLALMLRSRAYLAAGNYTSAVRDADQYLRHRPDNALVWQTRGRAHLAMRMFPSALADLNKSIGCEPSADAYAFRANCHYKLYRRDAAFADANRALSMDGNQKMAHLVLAMLYNDAGDSVRHAHHWQLAR